MKRVQVTHFMCEGCEEIHSSQDGAEQCEARHIKYASRGDVGDTVRYDFGFHSHARSNDYYPCIENAVVVLKRIEHGNAHYLLERKNGERANAPGWSERWC